MQKGEVQGVVRRVGVVDELDIGPVALCAQLHADVTEKASSAAGLAVACTCGEGECTIMCARLP